MQRNAKVCFAKLERSDILPLVTNNKEVELTFSAKILGLIIRSDLKWNDHVETIVLSTAIETCKMILFFCTCVRPILEYASPVFHYSLPSYLSNDIEDPATRIKDNLPKSILSRSSSEIWTTELAQ